MNTSLGMCIIFIVLIVLLLHHFLSTQTQPIPVIIISYNMLTYVRDTVDQLLPYTNNIIIIDNNSSYPPLLEYLTQLEKETKVKVHRMTENHGHRVYLHPEIQAMVPDKYIITDPDLLFNPNLPHNFIDILSELSDKHEVAKVGFALSLDGIRPGMEFANMSLENWEGQFWKENIPHPKYVLYSAPIDTTFCLINRKYQDTYHNSIRVAGDFTAIHRPWLPNFKDELIPEELEYYQRANISSNFTK